MPVFDKDDKALTLSGPHEASDFARQKKQFFEMVEAQGQLQEAQDEYERMRRVDFLRRRKERQPENFAKRYSMRVALAHCMQKFPPNKRLQKLVQAERRADAEKLEMARQHAREKAKMEINDERRQAINERNRYVAEQLKGKGKTTIADDIEFARDNAHLIADPEDRQTWLLDPAEAPSASAWNMLMYAVSDSKAFFTMAIKELKPVRPTVKESSEKSGPSSRRPQGNARERAEQLLRDMSKEGTDGN